MCRCWLLRIVSAHMWRLEVQFLITIIVSCTCVNWHVCRVDPPVRYTLVTGFKGVYYLLKKSSDFLSTCIQQSISADIWVTFLWFLQKISLRDSHVFQHYFQLFIAMRCVICRMFLVSMESFEKLSIFFAVVSLGNLSVLNIPNFQVSPQSKSRILRSGYLAGQ
jgi:hypothetical protein